MRHNKALLCCLVFVVLSFSIFTAGCSSKDSEVPSEATPSVSQEIVAPPSNETTASSEPEKKAEPSPETSTVTDTKAELFDFEEDFKSWGISNWEGDNDGELAFKDVVISKDQKASGTYSAAISCDFKGLPGSSKTAKGAFRINFTQPMNLTGKTITAKIYLPEDLVAEKYNASPFGVQLYIKTTDKWSWGSGGWVDTINNLKPGWNEIQFSPKGMVEEDTRELGIQLCKGDKTLDWAGTIYIDEIQY